MEKKFSCYICTLGFCTIEELVQHHRDRQSHLELSSPNDSPTATPQHLNTREWVMHSRGSGSTSTEDTSPPPADLDRLDAINKEVLEVATETFVIPQYIKHEVMPGENMVKLNGEHVMKNVIYMGQPADTILSLKDGKMGAHRIVLVAVSEFLEQLLNEQEGCGTITLILPDITKRTMETLLSIAYTGKLIYSESEEVEVRSLFHALRFCKDAHLTIERLEIPLGFPKDSTTPPVIEDEEQQGIVESGELEEIHEKYRPSKWLLEVMPRRSPYYPQLGDHLIYLRQAHEMYIREIRRTGIYPLSKKDMKDLPWIANPDLRAEVPVLVVAIRFELKPPRVVSMKLGVKDWGRTGELTGETINVVYHDLPHVKDFLVLWEVYVNSILYNWEVGDRFRCLVGKERRLGTIIAKEPHDPQFPESGFMCYQTEWDNGWKEKMSPWDIQPIADDSEIFQRTIGHLDIPMTEVDLWTCEINETDWHPHEHRDTECLRLRTIIQNVMELEIAEPFLTPIELNKYPVHAYVVAYFVDLSTIKTRLENHFYRRLGSVEFDVKAIASNAEKLKKPHSKIVRQARIVRDICLKVMRRAGATDVTQVYRELEKNFKWN